MRKYLPREEERRLRTGQRGSWRRRSSLASLQDAKFFRPYPGCRFAQPRATFCDASGIEGGRCRPSVPRLRKPSGPLSIPGFPTPCGLPLWSARVKHRFALGAILQTRSAYTPGLVPPDHATAVGARFLAVLRATPTPTRDRTSRPPPKSPLPPKPRQAKPPSPSGPHWSSGRHPRGQSGVKPHALQSGYAARCWGFGDREGTGFACLIIEPGETEPVKQ
jgi:hypothetical protein